MSGGDSIPPGFIGPGTEVVELEGGMGLPGFQDAHVHPAIGGAELGECPITKLMSAAAVLDSIRSCASARPDLPWVRGGGWQLPLFPAANPSKALLDQAVPDRPLVSRPWMATVWGQLARAGTGRHHPRYARSAERTGEEALDRIEQPGA